MVDSVWSCWSWLVSRAVAGVMLQVAWEEVCRQLEREWPQK